MKKLAMAAVLTALTLAGTAQAGGGGTELGIAGYDGGIGVNGALGFPINIPALSGNGLNTYGELELGAGFTETPSVGADLSMGLLLNIEYGLDIYGSIGPGIGFQNDGEFGLAAEVGLNILINRTTLFVEGGAHPGAPYFTVGMQF
ncbi:hypothetical protein [Saccharospirillum mangrovi]|uniref:hypothetical protein n=1 Tax=Saccharospirillum mangrovi TaxID=2161747 RepID=UPI000D341889|nr:hypothetical protein [Saccharospirillum mangrovi]